MPFKLLTLDGVVMRMLRFKDLSSDRHPPPHRVWAHLHAEPKFDSDEENHIADCHICMRTYMLCLNSSTFGAVLRVLRETEAQESPKSGTYLP